MIAVPSKTVYTLDMFDYRDFRPNDEPGLDGLITDIYGRKYVGQQTGDMISNDTVHTYHMDEASVEQWLYTADDDDAVYYSEREQQNFYYGRAGFEKWLADTTEYKYDFQHYRQAPGPETALAMLIKDGHLPYGEYLVRVTW